MRGQCALPQSDAILGCLQLLHECRAAVCVPGFTVGSDGSAAAGGALPTDRGPFAKAQKPGLWLHYLSLIHI